ncbi:MAG: hypothetical protein MUQ30_11995, partial [Anaerolineae bacterium]|nr:hypothetical protein [Anaerolineae bacterium]
MSETDRDPTQTPEGADSPLPTAENESALERYRVYGRLPERYWSQLFAVTEDDLARLATQMRESGRAMTPTELARDVIRARLQAEPQLAGEPPQSSDLSSWTVRQWDPGTDWFEGDRMIIVVATSSQDPSYAPCVGEVIYVEDNRVVVDIDGLMAPQIFEQGPDAQARESQAAEAE